MLDSGFERIVFNFIDVKGHEQNQISSFCFGNRLQQINFFFGYDT